MSTESSFAVDSIWNHLTRWLDKKIRDAFSTSQKRHQIHADPLRPIAIPRFAPGSYYVYDSSTDWFIK